MAPENIVKIYEEADRLYSAEQVEDAIRQMGKALSALVQDKNPVMLAVMKGGLVIAGQLLTELDFPMQTDYLHATRYRNQTLGGALTWIKHPDVKLHDRTVVIIDDILDEGNTLLEVIKHCQLSGAREVLTAVLINKLHDRKADPAFEPDVCGLTVEDRFIFGYGMDYQGYWRNAPGIFAIKGK
jgi:hypoxanthine phosphoribosyltransferase